MLKAVGPEQNGWASAFSVYENAGRQGSSAGMLIAVRKEPPAMMQGVDHEGIPCDPRIISAVSNGSQGVICMTVYGHVEIELKDANLEMIMKIVVHVCASPGGTLTTNESPVSTQSLPRADGR